MGTRSRGGSFRVTGVDLVVLLEFVKRLLQVSVGLALYFSLVSTLSETGIIGLMDGAGGWQLSECGKGMKWNFLYPWQKTFLTYHSSSQNIQISLQMFLSILQMRGHTPKVARILVELTIPSPTDDAALQVKYGTLKSSVSAILTFLRSDSAQLN